MATKTPISILQELAIKSGYVPLYEEMKDKANLSFTYAVRYKEFVAKGTALNKKQAKQRAASNMLSLLMQENIIPQISEILSLKTESETNLCNTESSKDSSPDTDLTSITNYVGKIQEYCVLKNLPTPVYEIVDVKGVHHSPQFTMSCTISTMHEEATATTKKTAKQNVAKKMWEHISKMNNCVNGMDSTLGNFDKDLFKDVNILQVKTKETLSLDVYKKPASFYVLSKNIQVASVPISEHHLLFKTKYSEKLSMYKSVVLKDMLINKSSSVTKHTDEMIRFVSDCFNLEIQEICIETHKSEFKVIAMRIFDLPVMVEFGVSNTIELARHKAICNIITNILQFLA